MTREEALFKAKDVLNEATEYEDAVCYVTGDDREWLETAIEALEQVTSYETTIVKLTKAILEQEPKTGHWISYRYGAYYECSNCKESNYRRDKYCPNCGAKMESEEEE